VRMVCIALLLVMVYLGVVQAEDSLGVTRKGFVDFWEKPKSLQVSGNYAYLSGGQTGLRIIDLTNPSQPIEVERDPWAKWNTQDMFVTVQDTLAYISYRRDAGWVSVLNVADPAHPSELRYSQFLVTEPQDENDPRIVFVHGNIAVGLRGAETPYPFLVDVTDWDNPVFTYDFYLHCNGNYPVGMVGDYLCLAGGRYGEGVDLFDISDPAAPVLVGSYVNWGTLMWSAVLDSNIVYFASQTGVHIIDVSDPFHPADVDSVGTGYYENVYLNGSRLYASRLDQTLDCWDVSDRRYPQFLATGTQPADYQYIVASASRTCALLYHAASGEALAVLDLSNPAAPVETARIGQYSILVEMTASDNLLCVADLSRGFRLFDLSDPDHFRELGHGAHSFYGPAMGAAIRQPYVYVSQGGGGIGLSGIYTYDVSEPAQPESLTYWPCSPNSKVGIYRDSAYARCLISTAPHGFHGVFSLANPAAPTLADSITVEQPIVSDSRPVSNGYLYTYEDVNRLGVYSMADPTAPQLVGWCFLPASFARAAVSGDYLYVMCTAIGFSGVCVVDIHDPHAPHVVGNLFGSAVNWLAVAGTTLVMYDTPRVVVMDVSNPLSPQEIGHYDTGGPGEPVIGMRIIGQYAATITEGRVALYEVDALANTAVDEPALPREFALRPAYPNPFNPSTVIRFSLPRMEPATLAVYDITGRQVQTLTDAVLSAGEHRVTFDGSALASGVYFARLEAGRNAQVQKMMLLK
jgi:hypothetical protein